MSEETKNIRIAYRCNGLMPKCSDRPGCFRFLKPGMCDCHHTFDPKYAVNGACENPEEYPERFELVKEPSGCEELWWEGGFSDLE